MSRNARLLVLVGAIDSLPFGVLAVGLPLYLKFLGYEEGLIGLLFTINGGVAVILTVPFGIVADRYGRKRMAVAGGLASSVSFFLFLGAPDPSIAILAAACGGLAEALVFSTLQALLAESSTSENRTAVFGISFFAGASATALGGLAATTPEFLRTAGWSPWAAYAPLLVGTGLALLAGPILILRTTLPETRTAGRRGLLPRRSASLISKFLVTNLIIGLGAGLIVPIFSLWFFLKFGQTEAFMGPLFATGSALNAVAFLASPLLARRYGMIRTVFALSAGGTLMLFGLALIPSLPLAAVLYLARNSAMNMSWPILSSFLMGTVHPEERSSASAVVGVSFRFPFAISTAFGAAMMAQSVDLPLFVTATVYAIGTASILVFFRGMPEPEARPGRAGS
jgi:MFS family permease